MRRLLWAIPVMALLTVPRPAPGNGDGVAAGPPTVYERFVLSACSPCIRESYPIAAVAIRPLTIPWLPRAAAGLASRPGEVTIEVLRARQPNRPDWRSLALRLTLFVTTAGGDPYRVGVGLLDGPDVAALASAVAGMASAIAAPGPPGAESVEVDFHGGSLRVGVLRLRGDAVAYVQAGDLPTLMQRALWDVPSTFYLPVDDLAGLAAALGQAASTIERVRAD